MEKNAIEKKDNPLFGSELFKDVQLSSLFNDSKTFSDAIAKEPIQHILARYAATKTDNDFDLKDFVAHYFEMPISKEDMAAANKHSDVLRYIETLWSQLTRTPDTEQQDSLIPLPNPYIVPGGRFQEIYYWDTYFTALGLELDGQHQLILDTFRNFQHLINVNDCIPNGNRDYYRGRSQPPILAMLFELVLQNSSLNLKENPSFLDSGISSLIQEHDFWMRGKNNLSEHEHFSLRVVKMPDGTLLNRYWDDVSGPRPESFKEDMELAENLDVSQKSQFYKNIRAACESGWDFSSRWLKKPEDLNSIQTTQIVPVDLNCLLWKLESSIADHLKFVGKYEQANAYQLQANARKAAIQKYCWNEEAGFYHDYCFSENKTTSIFSLAAAFPLYFELATAEQAESVAAKLETDFLKPGGLVTTLTQSPQQWDSPNGWAPLQWIAVVGLENYGKAQLAQQVMSNWNRNVELCFEQTGSLMEKYNVELPGQIATGGEYQVQHGFGWTNGVTRAFIDKLVPIDAIK